MYDDFREVATGALSDLHDFLNDKSGMREFIGEARETHNQHESGGNRGTVSNPSVQAFHTAQDGANISNDSLLNNLPIGLRRRGQGRTDLQGTISANNTAWVLPIFQCDRYVTKVKHLPVSSNTSDEALFTTVKARYHEETSRLRRFFAMRGVQKISYVKVRPLDNLIKSQSSFAAADGDIAGPDYDFDTALK